MKFPDTPYDELDGDSPGYRRQRSNWKLSLAKLVVAIVLVIGSLFYMSRGIHVHLPSGLSWTEHPCAMRNETPPVEGGKWFLSGYGDIGCRAFLIAASGSNATKCVNLAEGITALSVSWIDASESFELDLFSGAGCETQTANLTATTLCSPVEWVSYLVKTRNSTKTLPSE